jgi:hypothetical protein
MSDTMYDFDHAHAAALYEKAYAQSQAELHGGRFGEGYDAVRWTGGDSDPLATITGQHTETMPPDDVDFGEISDALEDHKPILVTTSEEFTGDVPTYRYEPDPYSPKSEPDPDWPMGRPFIDLPSNTTLRVLDVGSYYGEDSVSAVTVCGDGGRWYLTEEQYKRLIATTSISGK